MKAQINEALHEEVRAYLLTDFDPDSQGDGDRQLAEVVELRLMEASGERSKKVEGELENVEAELIDEYVWGELSELQRRLFEDNFLRAPRRRRPLSFALGFAPILKSYLEERGAPQSSGEVSPVESRPFRNLSAWVARPAWSMALAATLVAAIIGGVWLFVGKLRLETRLDQAHSAQAALAESEASSRRQMAEQRARGESLKVELLAERSQRASLERELEAVRAAGDKLARKAGLGSFLASVWLTPGLLRGGGETERVIIPADASLLQLLLDLGVDDYASYRASLHEAAGDELWSQAKLQAESFDSRVAVDVTLPTKLLLVGDYYIRLSGATTGGELELAGRYYFRILRN